MSKNYFVVPELGHNQLVEKACLARGFDADEVADVVKLCADAARHGIHTHNAIKALHLDDHFGSKTGGCVPGARIVELSGRFRATRVWNANKKIGPPVAYRAISRCMELADQFGVGTVSVDNAWHYFWGGGYVLEAARKGYIAYTNCTAMLAEVVPYGGTKPTIGTNPHTWAFPTTDSIGFPILVDWATSAVSMGRVQQLKREGGTLPPGSAIGADGQVTQDPAAALALLPFGQHKGYGLGLVDELFAAFIGGWRPTVRGRHEGGTEKHSPCFFFMAIHPDAISGGNYFNGMTCAENVKAVLQDILGPGNEGAIWPGELEARAAQLSAQHGGFLFDAAEIEAFRRIAVECGETPWEIKSLKSVTV